MNIALGMKLQDGPFGGGNQFGKALSEYLTKHGHDVFFDLKRPDLDAILMTDPRTSLKSVSFGPIKIMNYVRNVNPSVLLVHRVNECDERKGTHYVNNLLSRANSIMDHTVFISSWLSTTLQQRLTFTQRQSVILNGADASTFTFQQKTLPTDRKILLVTHHWSDHTNKGWDVYQFLDTALATTPLGDLFEFHFIGKVPNNSNLRRIIVHQPCSGKQLANLLQSCDIYLSASLNEPAGMHHIEGALCGLPLLYRDSGALPEYCQEYGVAFHDSNDVISALENIVTNYTTFAQRLNSYIHTNERMCAEYLTLFETLIQDRQAILQARCADRFAFHHLLAMHLRDWQGRLFSHFN